MIAAVTATGTFTDLKRLGAIGSIQAAKELSIISNTRTMAIVAWSNTTKETKELAKICNIKLEPNSEKGVKSVNAPTKESRIGDSTSTKVYEMLEKLLKSDIEIMFISQE